MSAKIKDIAAEAGVSPATVSLAINNKPGVGQKTRDKILKITRELEYTGPSTRQSGNKIIDSICFLQIARHGHAVNRDHDVFIADYIRGMSRESKEKSFNLNIITYKTTPIEEIVEFVRENKDSGIIILGTELSFEDMEAFNAVEKPIVFIDSYYKYLRFDFIDMNNDDSVNQIIQNLVQNGHTSIGMATATHSTPNFKLREKAFKTCLEHYHVPLIQEYIFPVDSTFDGAYEDMLKHLEENNKLPSALFCANDIMACGCLKALNERGISVPDEISLVGFDNLPISAMSTPGLTTIEVSKIRMGRMAVQLLADRIRVDSEAPPAKVLFGGKIIERNSVKDIS